MIAQQRFAFILLMVVAVLIGGTIWYECEYPCKRYETREGLHVVGWFKNTPMYGYGPYQVCVEREGDGK